MPRLTPVNGITPMANRVSAPSPLCVFTTTAAFCLPSFVTLSASKPFRPIARNRVRRDQRRSDVRSAGRVGQVNNGPAPAWHAGKLFSITANRDTRSSGLRRVVCRSGRVHACANQRPESDGAPFTVRCMTSQASRQAHYGAEGIGRFAKERRLLDDLSHYRWQPAPTGSGRVLIRSHATDL